MVAYFIRLFRVLNTPTGGASELSDLDIRRSLEREDSSPPVQPQLAVRSSERNVVRNRSHRYPSTQTHSISR